jgi:hypothetical protein
MPARVRSSTATHAPRTVWRRELTRACCYLCSTAARCGRLLRIGQEERHWSTDLVKRLKDLQQLPKEHAVPGASFFYEALRGDRTRMPDRDPMRPQLPAPSAAAAAAHNLAFVFHSMTKAGWPAGTGVMGLQDQEQERKQEPEPEPQLLRGNPADEEQQRNYAATSAFPSIRFQGQLQHQQPQQQHHLPEHSSGFHPPTAASLPSHSDVELAMQLVQEATHILQFSWSKVRHSATEALALGSASTSASVSSERVRDALGRCASLVIQLQGALLPVSPPPSRSAFLESPTPLRAPANSVLHPLPPYAPVPAHSAAAGFPPAVRARQEDDESVAMQHSKSASPRNPHSPSTFYSSEADEDSAAPAGAAYHPHYAGNSHGYGAANVHLNPPSSAHYAPPSGLDLSYHSSSSSFPTSPSMPPARTRHTGTHLHPFAVDRDDNGSPSNMQPEQEFGMPLPTDPSHMPLSRAEQAGQLHTWEPESDGDL